MDTQKVSKWLKIIKSTSTNKKAALEAILEECTFDELEIGSVFRYRDTIYMKILPRHISPEVEVNAIYIAGANKPMYEYFEPKRLYCTYTYELDRS